MTTAHRWDDLGICLACDALDHAFRCDDHGALNCCDALPDVCSPATDDAAGVTCQPSASAPNRDARS